MTAQRFSEINRLPKERKTEAFQAVVENHLSTDETRSFVAKLERGEDPEGAVSRVLLERETWKPDAFVDRKAGIVRMKCRKCSKVLRIAHRHGDHVLISQDE